jgi:hypothetical protein
MKVIVAQLREEENTTATSRNWVLDRVVHQISHQDFPVMRNINVVFEALSADYGKV